MVDIIFGKCTLCNAIINKTCGILNFDIIAGANKKYPYVFVEDKALHLKVNIMKLYPAKILHYKELVFNYRLSHARRVIENSIGITASRFRKTM